ncbi:unannotated protein [freshwater metagenome]|uniref:Unannotated protein n=1 Tax=freshwater metagenome TaxID=449393 RepID=A0A6J7EFY3_9ZZZZ
MQFGAVCGVAGLQSLVLDAVKVTPAGVVSLANKLILSAAPAIPEVVSGTATETGGAETDSVIVEVEVRPNESAATYSIGVAVPVKVASGVKVTRPVVVSTM